MDADRNVQCQALGPSIRNLHKTKMKNLKFHAKGPGNEHGVCFSNVADKFYDLPAGNEGQKNIAEFGVKKHGRPVYCRTAVKQP